MKWIILVLVLVLVIGCTSELDNSAKDLDQNVLEVEPETASVIGFTVSSPEFADFGRIPATFTCDSENINPELNIAGVPESAKSLALIMDDPDAPSGMFVHWVMWNIPVTDVIEEDSAPGTEGLNGRGETGYIGPCPPSGEHRYFFKLYALDTTLDLPQNTDKEALLSALEPHTIESAELVGLYSR